MHGAWRSVTCGIWVGGTRSRGTALTLDAPLLRGDCTAQRASERRAKTTVANTTHSHQPAHERLPPHRRSRGGQLCGLAQQELFAAHDVMRHAAMLRSSVLLSPTLTQIHPLVGYVQTLSRSGPPNTLAYAVCVPQAPIGGSSAACMLRVLQQYTPCAVCR
jgi:hypothetical protein